MVIFSSDSGHSDDGGTLVSENHVRTGCVLQGLYLRPGNSDDQRGQ